MKTKTDYFRFISFIMVIFFAFIHITYAKVVVYPVPPGLRMRPDFTLKANDTPVLVERIGSKMHSFSHVLCSRKEMEELNVANFSYSGEVIIEITVVEDITFEHCPAGGKVLTGLTDVDFSLNSFTRNINFK